MAIAYRAYYAFINRPLKTSSGENTSAIYGFITTLTKVLNEKPDYLAVVFDRAEPTFRHDMYPEYKATRQKMPEDMASQLPKLKEVIKAHNVSILELPGYEADDIMGTLARRVEKEGIETYLITGDKDFMQLISPSIKIMKPGKTGDEWEIMDFEHVEEKFGVTPDKVTDVLGLTGDKSDNVPGVPGIGEVTAIPLIQKFGSIERLYENIDTIEKASLKKKLENNKEIALLSKLLVTIDTNVPLDLDIEKLICLPENKTLLKNLFKELEFKSLLNKLDTPEILETALEKIDTDGFSNIIDVEYKYKVVDKIDDIILLIRKIEETKYFVFDTETTGTDPITADLIGISISLKSKEAFYIPFKSEPSYSSVKFKELNTLFDECFNDDEHTSSDYGFKYEEVFSLLSGVFNNSEILKIGQNVKYDLTVLAKYGIKVFGNIFDTMVASYILKPENRHNLTSMAKEFLKYQMITYEDLLGDEVDIRKIPLEKISEYSCEDADITLQLFNLFSYKLLAEGLSELCEKIEFPLVHVLTDMETTGIKIDVEHLAKMSKALDSDLNNLTGDIYRLAGKEFNINSTQQLGKILFENLKLTGIKKTKTGFSTDSGVLEALKNEHPIIKEIIDYRTLSKLKSTYIDALPSLVNPLTGRIHTSYNQTITTTGRLSSSNPNLQNIPIRSELGKEIRKAFIPENRNWLILSADYSQIELRIMAHISDDPGFVEAFKNGEDIHATTAMKIFGYTESDWHKLPKDIIQDLRRKAKEVNFGILYGLGPFGLAKRLDISQSEAKEIIDTYHKRFPNVKVYMEETIKKTKKNGYVETLLGRRRFLPDILSRNKNIQGNAERQAINMPIQGTAADMIKIAMVSIHELFDNKFHKNTHSPVKMLLQVHDELVFEVRKDFCEEAEVQIIEKMKAALPLKVPIEVESGTGNNWFEAH